MDNFYSKLITRETGLQVKIEISLSFDTFRNTEVKYQHTLFTREKGKRKWVHFPTLMNGRLNKEALEIVSKDELLQTKIIFWDSLKPVL